MKLLDFLRKRGFTPEFNNNKDNDLFELKNSKYIIRLVLSYDDNCNEIIIFDVYYNIISKLEFLNVNDKILIDTLKSIVKYYK